MQAESSNPNNTFMMCEDKDAIIAKRSVRRADALVAELKHSEKCTCRVPQNGCY
jgi:hypothetical protein